MKTDSTRAVEACGPQKYEDSFSQSTSPHVYFFITNAFFKKKLINLAALGLSCGGRDRPSSFLDVACGI